MPNEKGANHQPARKILNDNLSQLDSLGRNESRIGQRWLAGLQALSHNNAVRLNQFVGFGYILNPNFAVNTNRATKSVASANLSHTILTEDLRSPAFHGTFATCFENWNFD